jgi:hypothetical protein
MCRIVKLKILRYLTVNDEFDVQGAAKRHPLFGEGAV